MLSEHYFNKAVETMTQYANLGNPGSEKIQVIECEGESLRVFGSANAVLKLRNAYKVADWKQPNNRTGFDHSRQSWFFHLWTPLLAKEVTNEL